MQDYSFIHNNPVTFGNEQHVNGIYFQNGHRNGVKFDISHAECFPFWSQCTDVKGVGRTTLFKKESAGSIFFQTCQDTGLRSSIKLAHSALCYKPAV